MVDRCNVVGVRSPEPLPHRLEDTLAEPTVRDVIRVVAEFCARNAQSDSPFLSPSPPTFVVDATGLLDELTEKFPTCTKDEVGAWIDAVHNGGPT